MSCPALATYTKSAAESEQTSLITLMITPRTCTIHAATPQSCTALAKFTKSAMQVIMQPLVRDSYIY
jgi:hypothetical protein